MIHLLDTTRTASIWNLNAMGLYILWPSNPAPTRATAARSSACWITSRKRSASCAPARLGPTYAPSTAAAMDRSAPQTKANTPNCAVRIFGNSSLPMIACILISLNRLVTAAVNEMTFLRMNTKILSTFSRCNSAQIFAAKMAGLIGRNWSGSIRGRSEIVLTTTYLNSTVYQKRKTPSGWMTNEGDLSF